MNRPISVDFRPIAITRREATVLRVRKERRISAESTIPLLLPNIRVKKNHENATRAERRILLLHNFSLFPSLCLVFSVPCWNAKRPCRDSHLHQKKRSEQSGLTAAEMCRSVSWAKLQEKRAIMGMVSIFARAGKATRTHACVDVSNLAEGLSVSAGQPVLRLAPEFAGLWFRSAGPPGWRLAHRCEQEPGGLLSIRCRCPPSPAGNRVVLQHAVEVRKESTFRDPKIKRRSESGP